MNSTIIKIESAGIEEDRISFDVLCSTGQHAKLRIVVISGKIFRFTLAPGDHGNSNEIPLKRCSKIEQNFEVLSEKEKYVVKTEGLTLHLWIDPYKLEVYSSNTKIAEEHNDDKNVRDEYLNQPLGFQTESLEHGAAKAWTCFRLHQDEHLYGLGEKFCDFDKRGKKITVWNKNPFGSGSELAHKNIPFFLSSRGYGLLLNSTVRSHFDFGVESHFSLSIMVEDDVLDYFFILGPTYKEILFNYCTLTGFPPVPPLWSFGIWVSFMGEYMSGLKMDQENILKLSQELRDNDVPCDVIHLDPFWMEEQDYSSLTWAKRINDPKSLIKDLEHLGFRLCLWEHPYINQKSSNFLEAKKKGYLIKDKDGKEYLANIVYRSAKIRSEYSEERYDLGGFIDFTNPDAVEWFKEKDRRLIKQGVAAFKTDFGEEIPEDAQFYSGRTGLSIHNLYPLLYNKAVYEVLQEYYEKPVVWGRSGFAGSQQYPVCWSGDPFSNFESMRTTLKGGLSLAMGGFGFWSHDIGGFKGDPEEALYIRWLQFGLLSSHSRLHGTSTRLPWKISRKALEVFKKYAKLRYRLLPYFYSIAHEASKKGLPVIRPMVLEFQKDKTCELLDSQYMLGPFILVAPVWEKSGDVSVYLPAGYWYDYWTGERVQGKKWLHKRTELDHIPIYIMEGAIIPYQEKEADRVLEHWEHIHVDIYAGKNTEFIIRQPNNVYTKVGYNETAKTIAFDTNSVENGYTVRIHGASKPGIIVIDDDRKLSYDWRNGEFGVLEIEIGRIENKNCRVYFGEQHT